MNTVLSPTTGRPMVLVKENDSVVFRGETYNYIHLAYRCVDSGEQFTTTELDTVNVNQVYNAYRERHNIPFVEEIIAIRKYYGLSASKMSEILGFGANQWRRYENGDIPNDSNARVICAIRNKDSFLSFLESARYSIDADEYEKILTKINSLDPYVVPRRPTINNGYISISIKKISEIVKYFAYNIGGVFVTKMNKLLFYTDFIFYKLFGRGMTGIEYKAIKYGPVPTKYGALYDDATDIRMEEYLYNDNTSGIILYAEKEPDMSIFSENEVLVLKQVYDQFSAVTAGEISNISHNEIGWKQCYENKSIIPYSYALMLN